MNILAISGSLRAGSFNTAILRTMAERAPDGVDITIADISVLPFYSEDEDVDGGPQVVQAFKADIAGADALLIATPEYNYSMPGVLKNAIDWASRPGYKSVLKGKLVGILSASMAGTGGARAQQHLKAVLAATLSDVFVTPEVVVAQAQNMVSDGRVEDERTLKYLDRLMQGLVSAASARKRDD